MKQLININNSFLHTNISQHTICNDFLNKTIETFNMLIKMRCSACLVVFYSLKDINSHLEEFSDKTVEIVSIQAGDAYLYALFLPTNLYGTHCFVKDIHFKKLQNTKVIFHFDDIPDNTHHLFNYINGFLFEIHEKQHYVN